MGDGGGDFSCIIARKTSPIWSVSIGLAFIYALFPSLGFGLSLVWVLSGREKQLAYVA